MEAITPIEFSASPARRLATGSETIGCVLAAWLTLGIWPLSAEIAPVAMDLQTVAVEAARIERETAFDGVLEAVHQSTVAAETSARVEEIFFDVGDYVEQAQVIIRLRDAEQQARLATAEARLAEAQARVAEADVHYQRTKELFDRKLMPKATLDAAAADLRSARARGEAAQAVVLEAREGTEYTVIRAPYSGTVVKRHIEVGETATVGQPLMTGLSLDQLRAVVEIPQTYIAPLREQGKVRVILPDGKSLDASALRIPPNADPATHTFRVQVTLPKGEHGVFPGTLVKVAFKSGEQEQTSVPAAAVIQRSEVTAVYVVADDGRVSFRYVRAGTPTAGGRVPILAGLAPGERVAVDPIAAGVEYKKQARELARPSP